MRKIGKSVLLIFGFLFLMFSLASCASSGTMLIFSGAMSRDETKAMPKEWDNYEIKGFGVGDTVEYIGLNNETRQDLKIGDVIIYTSYTGTNTITVVSRIVDILGSDDDTVLVTQYDRYAQAVPYDKNASDSDKFRLELAGYYDRVFRKYVTGKVVSVIYKNK